MPVVAIDGHFQLWYGIVVRDDVSRQCLHADGLQRVITRENSVCISMKNLATVIPLRKCQHSNSRANSSELNIVADWSCTLTGRRSSPTLRSTTVTGTSYALLGKVNAVPGAYSSMGLLKTAASVWPRKPSCEVINNMSRIIVTLPKTNHEILDIVQPTDPSSSDRNRIVWAAVSPNRRRS